METPIASPAPQNPLPPNGVEAMIELYRIASSCSLADGTFYANGVDVTQRMHDLVQRAPLLEVLKLARALCLSRGMRHAPLWMLHAALHHPARHINSTELTSVIGEVCGSGVGLADELIAMYWKDGKRAIPKPMLRGLALAFLSRTSRKLLGNRAGDFFYRKLISAPLNSAIGKRNYAVLPSNVTKPTAISKRDP